MGLYFRGVLIFVPVPHTLYSKMLSGTMHVFAYLSMISSSIHAITEGRQHANLPWLYGIDLQLNTETNKLESVVNSDGKSALQLRFCC